jgi:Flp pilus assembly protein TadD
LGICLFEDGRSAEAAARLETALRLRPAAWETVLSLGTVYQAEGRPEQALAVYDRALSQKGAPNGAMRGRVELERARLSARLKQSRK